MVIVISVEASCPQCGGRMARYTDDLGRVWLMCIDCKAQIPVESGYREVKLGTRKSESNSRGTENKA